MIEHIEWRSPRVGEFPSPFSRGEIKRPLRITLLSESLTELSEQDTAAVEVLRELGHVPEIKILETKPSCFPHIEIGTADLESDIIPVQSVSNGTPQTYTYIGFPRQWPDIAARLVVQSDPDHQDMSAMLELILIAQAHCSLHGDIIVI